MLINLNHVVFALSPINGNSEPSIRMRLVVTISKNPATTSQNIPAGSSQAPEHENPNPDSFTASNELPNLEARAETDTRNVSARSLEVNPRLSLRINQLPSDQVPKAIDALARLESILSNLEGVVKIPDLVPEVINACVHSHSNSLNDLLTVPIDSPSSQRSVEPCQCHLPGRSDACRFR